MRSNPMKKAALAVALLLLGAGLLTTTPRTGASEPLQSIIVELDGTPPAAVAAHEAEQTGRRFDRRAHEQQVLAQQDRFLEGLRLQGVDFRITETTLYLADAPLARPNRFANLINAIGLEVPAGMVERIRALPGVREVTVDEPVRLHLDNSVEYVRASNGPGNKTIFSRAGGAETRFDGSGQVVAVLDTGIEHTHPTFDSRFGDDQFEMRTGDARPVRAAGTAYVEGVHHPKVVYLLALTATTNEDDVGHGTHAAADAAGLKVKGPGLDRIPGTDDDQIIEGVAPAALVMNYKVCETIFTCVGTLNIVTALEDALSPVDPLGNPKPVATVINMSFGSTSGNPNSATSVASNNAALAGAVVVSSAGNSGPNENTAGAPAVARRVIGVGATNDPGAVSNSVDVMVPDPTRYTVGTMSTGAQNDSGRPTAPEDRAIRAVLMGGAPDVPFDTGQHYVYAGFADTPDQIPDAVRGRIALASRGSTVDAGASGTGLFANKAAEAAAKGAIAILIFNNVDGELEAATTQASAIPAYGLSKANGEYLRDALGFASATFDKDDPGTWGTISNFPIRINLPNLATFSASTTGFSSRGPADNFQFVKPDITAPGQSVYAATIPAGGVSTGGGTMSDPSRYISVSGTSFSGPHIAGAAALLRQAILDARGETPIDNTVLRSGAAAASQQAQNAIAPQSVVRAALTNTATNLRAADGETPASDGDDRSFIHEIGGGLLHMIEAVDARAVMGTNDRNGPGGPDSAAGADFLPTHSFGQHTVVNTGDPAQTESITVTLENISGASGGGNYALRLVDGGRLVGDVTRPISGTTGFSLSLSTGGVALGSSRGDRASFDVTVTVDGRPAPAGLALAGADVTGSGATEFLWWVVAEGDNGETLRMPFYYRAVAEATVFRAAPFQNAIADDAVPDQEGGVDRDGSYRLSWTFPEPPEEQPCAYQVEEATSLDTIFLDDAEEPLVAGANSTWEGDPQWVSGVHLDTGTLGYQVVYIDQLNVALELSNPIPIPAGAKAQLVFDSLEDIEDDFDYGFVEVAGDNGLFLPMTRYTGFFSGQRVVDLSGFAGQDVTIRFHFTSDLLISSPLFLGWFIDNVEVQLADFQPIGTTDAATLAFDVSGRTSGTYFYRIAGLFGEDCDELGPYSNIREITVRTEDEPETFDPTAAFTATPNPAEVGQTVTFDASASTDNDDVGCDTGSDGQGCIASYFWSFGDGTTATTSGPVTTHTYSAPGTYRVLLEVTDNDGEKDDTEQFVEVIERPVLREQKVTGGGWIPGGGGGKANFGFNAKKALDGTLSGHLNYHDKNGDRKVLSESITSLSIDGDTATFSGTCSINKVSGFTFTVQVTDNGEPGDRDDFTIRLSDGYDNTGTLGGGNIQIHD